MPIPKPRTGEKQDKFIPRCIRQLKGEDPSRPDKQIQAICFSTFRESKKVQKGKPSNNFNVFIPFNKVDEDERIVEGFASTEDLDSDGEIITKEAVGRAIPNFMSLPGGGNLREMHQLSAVGKVPFVQQDKQGKTFVRAKVVDDNAWKKVKEKVYTGFSMGGTKLAQLGNRVTEILWNELSLVDRGANPGTIFTLIKREKPVELNRANLIKMIHNAADQVIADIEKHK